MEPSVDLSVLDDAHYQTLSSANNQLNISGSQPLVGFMASARTVDEFKQRVDTIIKRLGFPGYHFARLESLVSEDELAGMITTLPLEFMNTYKSEALYEEDIFLRYAQRTLLPFYQSDLEYHFHTFSDITNFSRTIEVKQLSQSHGVYESYNVSVPSSFGKGNATTLSLFARGAASADIKRLVSGKERFIHLLADVISTLGSLKYPQFFGPACGDKINYLRWREVLEMMIKEDLNQEQVAEKFGLSVRTVQDHLKRAKLDLGVRNLHVAAAKATALGLIRCE